LDGENMMHVFDHYAAYYDLLYRDKDYAAEAAYIESLLGSRASGGKRLLELGCGTGGHAVELARRGFSVHGIDLSMQMVERAVRRLEECPSLAQYLHFEQGDIRSARCALRFDAVISLFHVMSYQTSNQDLRAAIATARAHLDPGGVFLFDFWYGPAVLSDRPKALSKQVSDEVIEVTRRTTPTMLVNENCVDVHFDVDITARAGGERRQLAEDHRMRYLFLPEIEGLLGLGGFRLCNAYAWRSVLPPADSSWYVCAVAQAV
jgi:SAM-dependent methyltransferase